MADQSQTAEHPPSTEPEGRSAYAAGVALSDCPYCRGEDRWAWQNGWHMAQAAAPSKDTYLGDPSRRGESSSPLGNADEFAMQGRHLTQSGQHMMDAALRRSVRPAPADDMWRVDVAGIPISVRGEAAKDHLEAVVRQMARMKLALNKLKWEDGKVGETAKAGLS